jgi:hypothetical protein
MLILCCVYSYSHYQIVCLVIDFRILEYFCSRLGMTQKPEIYALYTHTHTHTHTRNSFLSTYGDSSPRCAVGIPTFLTHAHKTEPRMIFCLSLSLSLCLFIQSDVPIIEFGLCLLRAVQETNFELCSNFESASPYEN